MTRMSQWDCLANCNETNPSILFPSEKEAFPRISVKMIMLSMTFIVFIVHISVRRLFRYSILNRYIGIAREILEVSGAAKEGRRPVGVGFGVETVTWDVSCGMIGRARNYSFAHKKIFE